jgi:hypothetical protein
MGTATSTLGTVSDISTFDTVNSVTFTLKYEVPPPFVSQTQNDLLFNPRRNLFLVGNEYIQAATVVDNGNRSYTISTLLRGRMGTEQNTTHGSGERVVFLNGSERLVPIDLGRLNRPFNFKVVTTNQDVSDATAIPFTWTGELLRPLAVSNPRGFRDSGNDLLIEFEGRTRIGGGLRSNQAGALNEEVEEYKVQILDGGSTTLPNGKERILTVIPGMQQAAVMIDQGGFTGISHNNVNTGDGRSFQIVHGPDNFIEATLRAKTSTFFYSAVGLVSAGGKWQTLDFGLQPDDSSAFPIPDPLDPRVTIPYLVVLEVMALGNQRLRVWEYGNVIFSASDKSSEPDYDANFGWHSLGSNNTMFRVRFNFVGSSVRIQKAHTSAVPLTTIVTGTRQVEFPMFVYAQGGGTDFEVQSIIMTTYPFPKTIYSASQMTEDLLTPGDPVEMDIWQYSKLVGDGHKVRVTL